jgi:hypothetical protein
VIIWDTGPLFAAADVDDRDHSRCVELMRHTPAPLLMPIPVLTEVGYLLEREKGARAEAEFLRSIRAGQVMMVPLTAADLIQASSAGPSPSSCSCCGWVAPVILAARIWPEAVPREPRRGIASAAGAADEGPGMAGQAASLRLSQAW